MRKAHIAFVQLALHAKLHRQLDTLDRFSQDVARIEKDEILAYDNSSEYARLERLKQDVLAIRFVK